MNNKRLPKSNFELKQGISKRRLDLPSNCKDLIELINQDKITELPDVCLQLASVQNEYYDKLDPLKLIEKAKKLKSIREREKFFKNDQGDFVIKHPLIPIFLGDSCFERGAFSRANNFYKQGLKLEEEEVFGYDRELNKRIRKTTKLMMNPPNPFYATSMLIKECKRRISDKID